MRPLDSYAFPLFGASLIEASAGTGKTYTIVNLYLRILLAHNTPINKPVGLGLGVDNILVVTFTNAATAELKHRIRSRIHSAYLDFYQGSSQDPFIQQLIEDTDDIQRACDILSLASKQMDEAAIFTIHSFCQKMLAEHAFESGSVFEESLQLDQSAWITQATQDFWRRVIVPLDPHLQSYAIQNWATPEALQKDLYGLLHRDVVPLQSVTLSEASSHMSKLRERTVQIKQWWQQQQLSAQLQQAKLHGRHKLGKPAIYQQIDDFVQSQSLLCPFEHGWQDWFPDKLIKATTAKSADVSHIDLSVFEDLDELRVATQNAIRSALLNEALGQVRLNLETFKKRTSQLSPDDLLTRLQKAINSAKGPGLCELIRRQYPAAMIDEFQDTDQIQFDVFSTIYPLQLENSQGYCLTLIGDPKQAIYGFRGADIFTYIHAKRLIQRDRHFTLAKNWRSQSNLVNSVNQLFSQSDSGFLYSQDIPFLSVDAAKGSACVSVANQAVDSLSFYQAVGDKDTVPDNEAKDMLAKQATQVIVDMLQHGKIGINPPQPEEKSIGAADICILVRNRNEAQIIKQSLSESNVDSVFLVRHSVFSSESALDIYRLLIALSQPKQESKVRAALLGSTFCLSAEALDRLFYDELAWQQLLEKFMHWHQQWQKQGLMIVINQVLQHFSVFSQLLAVYQDGLRRLTDLRHVIELLQQQSNTTPGESQLVYWMGQQIDNPDHNSESQLLRLETDSGLVQIITMHASKGLEFPLVFIPFASQYRLNDKAIFHAEDDNLYVDFVGSEDNLLQADKERLAEDIRLFYVALTRAIYYCFVGVWNTPLGRSKSRSGLSLCAVGSLVLKAQQEPSSAALNQQLNDLTQLTDAGVTKVTSLITPSVMVSSTPRITDEFQLQTLETQIDRQWRITSYSAIARNQFEIEHEKLEFDEVPITARMQETVSQQFNESGELALTRFTFPRGAQPGSFLHGVLENLDFTQPQASGTVIEQQGRWFGIEELWYPCVQSWIHDVLTTPIPLPKAHIQDDFVLSSLSKQQICVEMEFHLPLNKVDVTAFNQLINSIFPTTQRHYDFTQLHGMLKGFIDLTFCINGQFFVADYKSNHLGDNDADYNDQKMVMAMRDHDYDLQSLLYVLALHRFLKVRIDNYDYDTHIGGAYYWFLRGMSREHKGHGVLLFTPQKSTIEKLDVLFSGQQQQATDPHSQPTEQLGLW